jgi:signal transduction histidine kinase
VSAVDSTVTLTGLDRVLVTHQLVTRPASAPDHHSESEALRLLGRCLAAQPETMLDRLADVALRLCRAGSAGVSVIETKQDGEHCFRWVALAGELAPFVGGTVSRWFSPCAVTLERGGPQLFRRPAEYFTEFQAATPAIDEGLVIPIVWHGEPLGTIWIVSHDVRRAFDREDVRLMESLADFTAAALRVTTLKRESDCRVVERTAELRAANARLEETLAECRTLEAARSEWLAALMTAQEDERRRVVRELHDEMGQHLTGLMLGLDALPAATVQDISLLAHLQGVVADLEQGVRRLAAALRPAALDDLGLVTALGSHVDDWSRQTGVTADFCSRIGERRLPPAIETTLYRVVQEALTNVARHAHASTASVVLEHRDDRVVVIIDDDGRGFDTGACRTDGRVHAGLTGIRERAALLGGKATIESYPNGGTSIFVSLPCVSATAHGA